jgi:hypothetical protein
MRHLALGILALAGLVTPAFAQPSAPPPNYPPPPSYPPPPYGQTGYAPIQGYVPYTPGQAPPGFHQHDGFYLRMFMGPGFTSASSSVTGTDVKVHGGGIGLGIALGGAVADNLIIYGELIGNEASGPDVEVGGTRASTSHDTSAGITGIGPGIAYYFMPLNFFLSATLAGAKYHVSQNGDTVGETNWGGAISLMIGKEWWVSHNWGIGALAQLVGASMKDKQEVGSPTWSVAAFTVAFSATFN